MKIFSVSSFNEGIEKAKRLFYKNVDRQTLLFLSGGSSPKQLYETLASEKQLAAGAAAMIDERYGAPFHPRSNEKMIDETGVLRYLKSRNIPWYPILQKGLSRNETAKGYEKTLESLFTVYPKRIAIVSIGNDGHTAGIPAGISNFEFPISNFQYVGQYENEKYGERITLTFKALEKMDVFLLWVMGYEKKTALKKMFKKGSEEEIPARFYMRKDISEKTIVITDQRLR